MEKIRAYLQLARIEHGIMTGLAVVAGFLAVRWCFCYQLLVAFVSSVLIEASLFALNDVFNLEEDKINSPDRPLVKGELTVREASGLALLLAILSILLASLLGVWPLLLLLTATIAGNLYNSWLKRLSIIGNMTVAGLTASSFLYGALATGITLPDKVILFFVIAFLANIGREIVKGIRDLEGDTRVGICTLPCEIGVDKAGIVAAVFMAMAVALSFAAVNYFTLKYLFMILILVTDAIFLHSIYLMVKEPTISSAARVRKTTLIGMLLAIISFVLP